MGRVWRIEYEGGRITCYLAEIRGKIFFMMTGIASPVSPIRQANYIKYTLNTESGVSQSVAHGEKIVEACISF